MVSNAARQFLDAWNGTTLEAVIQQYRLRTPHDTQLREAFEKISQKPVAWLYLKDSDTGALKYETYYMCHDDVAEDTAIYEASGDTVVTFRYPQTEHDFATFVTELVNNWTRQ